MGKLDGQVALITGAARGQGRSHAVTFAREGASIVGCDIVRDIATVPYALSTAEDLEETGRLVREAGANWLGVTADVRDSAAVQGVVDAALEAHGRIDILGANAGIGPFTQIVEMTDEQWHDVIETNLSGVFYAIRGVAKPMIERGYGRIIATASSAGRMGLQNFGHYVAAKWGLIGLVKSAALELGQHNITANAVCPGAVRTPMMVNDAIVGLFRPELENPTIADLEEIVLEKYHKLPTAWIEPHDVSNVYLFLASEEGRFVSGAAIDVNAGTSADWNA